MKEKKSLLSSAMSIDSDTEKIKFMYLVYLTIVSVYLFYLDNCILELLPRSPFTEVCHHVFHVLSSS